MFFEKVENFLVQRLLLNLFLARPGKPITSHSQQQLSDNFDNLF